MDFTKQWNDESLGLKRVKSGGTLSFLTNHAFKGLYLHLFFPWFQVHTHTHHTHTCKWKRYNDCHYINVVMPPSLKGLYRTLSSTSRCIWHIVWHLKSNARSWYLMGTYFFLLFCHPTQSQVLTTASCAGYVLRRALVLVR